MYLMNSSQVDRSGIGSEGEIFSCVLTAAQIRESIFNDALKRVDKVPSLAARD